MKERVAKNDRMDQVLLRMLSKPPEPHKAKEDTKAKTKKSPASKKKTT